MQDKDFNKNQGSPFASLKQLRYLNYFKFQLIIRCVNSRSTDSERKTFQFHSASIFEFPMLIIQNKDVRLVHNLPFIAPLSLVDVSSWDRHEAARDLIHFFPCKLNLSSNPCQMCKPLDSAEYSIELMVFTNIGRIEIGHRVGQP